MFVPAGTQEPGIPACSLLESAAGSWAAEGNRPCDEGCRERNERHFLEYPGQHTQDVMSGLDWADVVPQLLFFSHSAGKVDTKEIQR